MRKTEWEREVEQVLRCMTETIGALLVRQHRQDQAIDDLIQSEHQQVVWLNRLLDNLKHDDDWWREGKEFPGV